MAIMVESVEIEDVSTSVDLEQLENNAATKQKAMIDFIGVNYKRSIPKFT